MYGNDILLASISWFDIMMLWTFQAPPGKVPSDLRALGQQFAWVRSKNQENFWASGAKCD